MISTNQVKPYVFCPKTALTAEQVDEVLAAIQTGGKNIKNRTSVIPELANWETTLPSLLPPLGEAIVFKYLSSIDRVKLSWKFINTAPVDLFKNVFDEVAPYGRTGFFVALAPKTIPIKEIEAELWFDKGKIYFGFDFYCYDKKVNALPPDEIVALLEKIIHLAELPVRLEVKLVEETSPRPRKFNRYTLQHNLPGGELRATQSDSLPLSLISATFPGATVAEMAGRFLKFARLPEFRQRDSSWFFNSYANIFNPTPNPIGLVNKISQMGFPGKNVECTFLWHLKSYQDFKEMPKMLDFLKGGVTQYLLDFEFGAGRQCQVIAIYGKPGNYKLIFALDRIEDMPELAELVKLKLKKE